MGPWADFVAFVVALNRLERDLTQWHNGDVAALEQGGVRVL